MALSYETDVQRKERWLREEYERLMGKPPENRFEEDPDWLYRGSKAERESLAERFGLVEEDAPVVIEGQESLI